MYRKGVAAIILNIKNEILLVNLINLEEKYFSLLGGGIEDGESKEDTIIRETNEELGIPKEKLEIVKEAKGYIKFKYITGPKTMHGQEYIGQIRNYFLIRFSGNNSDIKIKEDEVRKYVWIKYDDIDKYIVFDNSREDVKPIIQELCPEIVKDNKD